MNMTVILLIGLRLFVLIWKL